MPAVSDYHLFICRQLLETVGLCAVEISIAGKQTLIQDASVHRPSSDVKDLMEDYIPKCPDLKFVPCYTKLNSYPS